MMISLDFMYKASSSGWECFDSNKTMSFKVIDNKLLKKYTEIWERVSNLMNIRFYSEPVYRDNDKYIKTNTKSCGDKK